MAIYVEQTIAIVLRDQSECCSHSSFHHVSGEYPSCLLGCSSMVVVSLVKLTLDSTALIYQTLKSPLIP